VVRQPRTRFVAQFLALGHFLSAEISHNCIVTEMGTLPLPPALRQTINRRQVDILVRPEYLQLCEDDGTPAQVIQSAYYGTRKLYTLRLPSGTILCGLFPYDVALKSGEQIRVTLRLTDFVTFPHTLQAPSC
jgi:ABC-type Fe3+/spermidine/putrescine transport system ATPase subunit